MRYPNPTREIEHLVTHSNVMYRVITQSGEQLVLRVGTPHANTRSNIEFEVAWLDAISRDTSLDVVAPIYTADGELIIDEFDAVLGMDRPCVLFRWVPGAPLGDGAGTFGYRLLGQMLALLQQHGKTWTPPDDIGHMRRWDQIFYYDSQSDPVVITNQLYSHLFDAPRLSLIGKATKVASKVLEESWDDDVAQVVHGDLHEWNVHFARSRLYAFDFEDVMVALPAQDVAISLFHTRNADKRDDVRSGFRRGFESVAVWPVVDESQLDGFHAARQLMLMNYAARTLPMGDAMEYLDQISPWLESFVRRYA